MIRKASPIGEAFFISESWKFQPLVVIATLCNYLCASKKLALNKSALTGLLIAIVIPFLGYFIMKNLGEKAMHMPPKYFYDSVATNMVRGKKTSDTIWHSVKNISLQNQFGKQVSLDDLKGKIIVMDFFFARCPQVCPQMTRQMKKVEASFAKNPDIVHFISMSIDPENDKPQVLRAFAERFGAINDNWWFVTGDKKEIYDFAIKEMKANVADTDVDTAFIHTEKFFLLDRDRVVRGFYDSYDSVAMARLAKDIPTLMLEKDRKKPSMLRKFIPILPFIFAGIAIVIIVMLILEKNKRKTNATTGY